MKSVNNFVIEYENGQIFDMHQMGVWVESFHIYSPNIERITTETRGLSGSILDATQVKKRKVLASFSIETDNFQDYNSLKHKIYDVFFCEREYKIIRDITPDQEIYVVQEGEYDIENITLEDGEFSIELSMLKPFIFGREKTEVVSSTSEIVNNGSVEVPPTFTLEVTKATPFIDIVSMDGYMRLGQVPSVEDTVYNPYQVLVEDYGSSVIGWTKTTFPNGFSSIASDGEILSSGEAIYPQSYGTGGQSNWFGPAIARSVGQQVQDFEIRVSGHQVAKVLSEVGRAELYALDVNNIPIARLSIVKATHGNVSTCECVIYDSEGNPYTDLLRITKDSVPTWTDFTGHIVLRRDGQSLTSYAALTSGPLGREKEKRTGSFQDAEGKFQRKLASIALVFQKFGTKPTLNRNRITYELAMKISKQVGIQNIVQPGDTVEIDHKTSDIRINGETRLIKTFGSRFFKLKPGSNPITVEPADALNTTVKWREAFH